MATSKKENLPGPQMNNGFILHICESEYLHDFVLLKVKFKEISSQFGMDMYTLLYLNG